MLLDLHRPLLHVRGMRRVWGLSKLATWLEGSGKADVTGRRGLVQVIRVLEEMHVAYGEGVGVGGAPDLDLEDLKSLPHPPFLKLSSCEGPQRRRARMVSDVCGSQHFEAGAFVPYNKERDREGLDLNPSAIYTRKALGMCVPKCT